MAKIIDTEKPHFGRLKRADGIDLLPKQSKIAIEVKPDSMSERDLIIRELIAQRAIILEGLKPQAQPSKEPDKIYHPAPVAIPKIRTPKEWFISISRDIYGHIKSAEATNKENKTAFCFYVDTYADGVAKSIRVVKK